MLIACGRTMACELLSEAFHRQNRFHVAACATSVDDASNALQQKNIDIALISPDLQDGLFSGIQLLRNICALFPKVKAVVLLENTSEDVVEIAFRAGARGVFSLSQDGFARLCRCVKCVHEGQVWANSAQLVKMLKAFSHDGSQHARSSRAERIGTLTKREKDVVRLVGTGLTNRQIAEGLHLSEHTIRNNMIQIFDKLGISTRVELALYLTNGTRKSIQGGDNHEAQPERETLASTTVQ